MRFAVAISALITLCVPTALASVENLNYDRVRLMGRVGDNFLFRGNQPQLNHTTFAWDELTEFLVKRSSEAGENLPTPFQLVDISLLQPSVHDEERVALQVEEDFFSAHPEKGDLISWPLFGSALDPYDPLVTAEQRMQEARQMDAHQDSLPSKVEYLHLQLLAKSNPPCVFYLHCGHGQDRTGELAGAYALQHLGASWHDVVSFNVQLGMDVPENMHELEWFCVYLQTKGYQLSCSSMHDAVSTSVN